LRPDDIAAMQLFDSYPRLSLIATLYVLDSFSAYMPSSAIMQFVLALGDRSQTLADVHRRLQRRFGRPGPFLQLDPVSQLIMGMVGGRTHGEVSKGAFEALLGRFGSWEAVRDASVAEIRETIGAVTFAEIKAPRLKAALQAVTADCGRLTLDALYDLTVDEALAWLERLPGVGRKVAAATLNFSTLRKPALVIDTHQLRVLRRLALVGPHADFRQAFDRVMPILPNEWTAEDMDEHHQLMKTLGQTTCRHIDPACYRCPLRNLCPTAAADLGPS
jgi:endonuclease III